MIINIVLFLIFGLGLFLSKEEELSENLDKGVYRVLKYFHKTGRFLYRIRTKAIDGKKEYTEGKLKSNLKFLSPGKSIRKEMEVYYTKKIGFFILIIFLFNTISFALNLQVLISKGGERLTALDRPSQGIKSYELAVTVEELMEKLNIVVQVDETWMDEGEVKEAFENSYKYLKEAILGENPSFEEVSSNLYFPENIPDTDITVNWETQNYQYIDNFGTIKAADIKEDLSTYVKATLSYKEYEEEYQFHVKLVPEKLDNITRTLKNINESVIEKEKKQKEEKKVTLPTEVNGKKVKFHKVQQEEGQSILLFGFLVAIVLFVLRDIKLSEDIQRKNRVLLTTYPEIVAKFTLLISAGMTIGRSWERIILDYKKKGIHNYAYEEMEVTYYEIQKGLSEGKAYGIFGKRCRLHPYIKLGGLLEQNLKKGNRGLEQLLREEVKEAFEDRKSRAKQLGEEASTKLLMPMFLMLAVVLIICMAPAFMGF
ncbi:MAG: hypothetical protein GX913_04560 [Clostridiales bacterium]|nr:hypothetical protein [Clostridiales bacterium]